MMSFNFRHFFRERFRVNFSSVMKKKKKNLKVYFGFFKSYHFSCLIFCIKMHRTERGDRRERPSMLSRVSFFLMISSSDVCVYVCVCVVTR